MFLLPVAIVAPSIIIGDTVRRLATGNENMDALAIRARVAVYSLVYGVSPYVVMAIIHNESAGNASNFLGDLNLGNGPSIGPMQVSRATAVDLGLWTPPDDTSAQDDADAFTALSSDIGLGVRWGCRILRQKLDDNGGDYPSAIRAYNGSNVASLTYQQNALSFLKSAYGLTL